MQEKGAFVLKSSPFLSASCLCSCSLRRFHAVVFGTAATVAATAATMAATLSPEAAVTVAVVVVVAATDSPGRAMVSGACEGPGWKDAPGRCFGLSMAGSVDPGAPRRAVIWGSDCGLSLTGSMGSGATKGKLASGTAAWRTRPSSFAFLQLNLQAGVKQVCCY